VYETGGLCSMDDDVDADDPNGPLAADQDEVTLRDAIETGDNGGGLGHGSTIEPITFVNPSNGDPLTGTITLQATLPAITKSYNIDGSGLTVSGNNSYGLFTVGGGVTSSISGLTIEYGSAEYGGGVYNSGTLTLANDTIANNDSAKGGGVFNTKGKTRLIKDDVTNNTATVSGGGIYNAGGGGTVTISGSDVYNNRVQYGAGIFNAGVQGGATLNIKNGSTIDYNTATIRGGGIYNSKALVSMKGGSIYDSISATGGAGGGGIFTVSGTLLLSDVHLWANFAKSGNGGGINQAGGRVTISSGTINSNYASNGQGGGIYVLGGTLTINKGTNIGYTGGGNTAITGGGMYLTGATTTNLNGCTVEGNKVTNPTNTAPGIAYTTTAKFNPPPPIPAANLTDKDDPGGQPVLV